jgi:hypothetical protein
VAPRKIPPAVARLIWHRREHNRIVPNERGLMLPPRSVRAKHHRPVYDELLCRLASFLQPATEAA